MSLHFYISIMGSVVIIELSPPGRRMFQLLMHWLSSLNISSRKISQWSGIGCFYEDSFIQIESYDWKHWNWVAWISSCSICPHAWMILNSNRKTLWVQFLFCAVSFSLSGVNQTPNWVGYFLVLDFLLRINIFRLIKSPPDI